MFEGRGPQPGQLGVEELFDPVGTDAFVSRYWSEQVLKLATENPMRFQGLFSLDELEGYMRMPRFFEHQKVALRDASRTDPIHPKAISEVFERISHGDTLQIIGLEHFLPDTHPLIRLYRGIEKLCGAPGRAASLFLTPPGRQGLTLHHDDFEIFTLQLAGSKRWFLYDLSDPIETPSEYGPTPEPSVVHDVSAGDFLYTPKCLKHRVESQDEMSLSVALVYEAQSWLECLAPLRGTIERDPDFFRSLPAPGLGTIEQTNTRLEEMRARLAEISPEDIAHRVTTERAHRIRGLHNAHLLEAMKTNGITPDTQVCLRQGPRPVANITNGGVMLVSVFCEPVLAPIRAASAIGFILESQGAFKVGDICTVLSDESKVNLIRRLMRKGVIQTS